MMHVTAQCSNPSELRICVTADMTVGEWENIIILLKDAQYYSPLSEFMWTIANAISSIKEREIVSGKAK